MTSRAERKKRRLARQHEATVWSITTSPILAMARSARLIVHVEGRSDRLKLFLGHRASHQHVHLHDEHAERAWAAWANNRQHMWAVGLPDTAICTCREAP